MILTIVECTTVILVIIMLIQFSKKNKLGWILSLITNVMWFYIGIVREVPVILIATVIYFAFNIRGYIMWRNDELTKRL